MSSRQLQRTNIENPTLELKIISANDVSYFDDATDKMDMYAVVSIKGDNTQKKQTAKTPIDYDGGSNPTWNHTVTFSVNEKSAREGLLTIHVKLYSYWLEDKNDIYLGKVSFSVRELLASDTVPSFANGNGNKMKFVTYPLKSKGETKRNAKLSLSYRFKLPVPVNNDLYPPPQELDYLPSFNQPVRPSKPPIMYSSQLQTNTVTELTLELVIKFAKDLKKINILNDMDVYASITIREGKKIIKNRSNTPVVFCPHQNPRWDHEVKFPLDLRLAQDGRLTLVVVLMSHRPFFGDKQIGEVNISIQKLLSLNPPSQDMMLVTEDVRGSYGKRGTLTFTYRFLTVQVEAPKPSSSVNNTQPFIMYVPVSNQEYTSPDTDHGTSGYMAIHPGANAGPSNGLVPIFMPPPYQTQGYQQFSQPQPQLPPQTSQTQQHVSQEQGVRPQQQLQSPRPHRPTESEVQTQGARPQVKPEGGSIATIGLAGAAAFGRVIGGAILSDIISGEINI